MLDDVLRLLQRDGSLLSGEVARRLGISVAEAEGAMAVLVAAGRLSRYRFGGGCSGDCGPCTSRGKCPLVEAVESRLGMDSVTAAGAARPV